MNMQAIGNNIWSQISLVHHFIFYLYDMSVINMIAIVKKYIYIINKIKNNNK